MYLKTRLKHNKLILNFIMFIEILYSIFSDYYIISTLFFLLEDVPQLLNSVILLSFIYDIIILVFIYYLYRKLKMKFKDICILVFLLIDFFPILKIAPYLLYNIYMINAKHKLYKQIAYDMFSKMNIKIHHNFDALPKTPSILLLNYPDNFSEYFIHGILPIDLVYITSKKAKFILGLVVNHENIISTNNKNNYENILSETEKKIKDRHILCYIEKSKKSILGLGRIRKGMFSIAKKLNVQITPICVDKIDHSYGIPKKQNFFVKVGKTHHVNNVILSKNIVKNFYKDSLEEFKTKKYVL
jgi:hypothetical protein